MERKSKNKLYVMNEEASKNSEGFIINIMKEKIVDISNVIQKIHEEITNIFTFKNVYLSRIRELQDYTISSEGDINDKRHILFENYDNLMNSLNYNYEFQDTDTMRVVHDILTKIDKQCIRELKKTQDNLISLDEEIIRKRLDIFGNQEFLIDNSSRSIINSIEKLEIYFAELNRLVDEHDILVNNTNNELMIKLECEFDERLKYQKELSRKSMNDITNVLKKKEVSVRDMEKSVEDLQNSLKARENELKIKDMSLIHLENCVTTYNQNEWSLREQCKGYKKEIKELKKSKKKSKRKKEINKIKYVVNEERPNVSLEDVVKFMIMMFFWPLTIMYFVLKKRKK